MSEPLVSVLIPCYNAERWIGQTLESVFAQTWTNIEVIVVNDGSTDASDAALRRLSQPRLKTVHQRNQGQTAALNRALAEAQGEFVQFLDADDLLGPEKIAIQMRRLRDEPDCLASAEWTRFFHTPMEGVFVPEANWQDSRPVDWLVHAWQGTGGMLFPALWLASRTLVDKVGPWRTDLNLANDCEYFTRLALSARRILFCPGAQAFYRSGVPGSLSGTRSKAGWQSQTTVLDLCERYLLAAEDSDRTRSALSKQWQRLAHFAYPYDAGIANHALARAGKLHDVRISPSGGTLFLWASALLGWKIARRLQLWSGRS